MRAPDGHHINRTIAITFFSGRSGRRRRHHLRFRLQTIAFDLDFAWPDRVTAAVFGGIGNVVGAAIGGFVIGIIIDFVGGYFAGGQQWSDVVVSAS